VNAIIYIFFFLCDFFAGAAAALDGVAGNRIPFLYVIDSSLLQAISARDLWVDPCETYFASSTPLRFDFLLLLHLGLLLNHPE